MGAMAPMGQLAGSLMGGKKGMGQPGGLAQKVGQMGQIGQMGMGGGGMGQMPGQMGGQGGPAGQGPGNSFAPMPGQMPGYPGGGAAGGAQAGQQKGGGIWGKLKNMAFNPMGGLPGMGKPQMTGAPWLNAKNAMGGMPGMMGGQFPGFTGGMGAPGNSPMPPAMQQMPGMQPPGPMGQQQAPQQAQYLRKKEPTGE